MYTPGTSAIANQCSASFGMMIVVRSAKTFLIHICRAMNSTWHTSITPALPDCFRTALFRNRWYEILFCGRHIKLVKYTVDLHLFFLS